MENKYNNVRFLYDLYTSHIPIKSNFILGFEIILCNKQRVVTWYYPLLDSVQNFLVLIKAGWHKSVVSTT